VGPASPPRHWDLVTELLETVEDQIETELERVPVAACGLREVLLDVLVEVREFRGGQLR
jgi:hypothetical protein